MKQLTSSCDTSNESQHRAEFAELTWRGTFADAFFFFFTPSTILHQLGEQLKYSILPGRLVGCGKVLGRAGWGALGIGYVGHIQERGIFLGNQRILQSEGLRRHVPTISTLIIISTERRPAGKSRGQDAADVNPRGYDGLSTETDLETQEIGNPCQNVSRYDLLASVSPRSPMGRCGGRNWGDVEGRVGTAKACIQCTKMLMASPMKWVVVGSSATTYALGSTGTSAVGWLRTLAREGRTQVQRGVWNLFCGVALCFQFNNRSVLSSSGVKIHPARVHPVLSCAGLAL